MNEDTINYKELYEQEQRKVKELKSEIIIIKYECLRLLTEHTQIQSSIMILQNGIQALSSDVENLSNEDYISDENDNYVINDIQSDINNNNWTDIDSIATFSSDDDEDDEFDGKQ